MKKLILVIPIGANDAFMHLSSPLCIGEKAYDEYVFAMVKGHLAYISKRTPISLDKVIALSDENQKVIVFPDLELYKKLLQEQQDNIDSLHVIKLLRDGESAEAFEVPSMLYWRPIIKGDVPEEEGSPPGITFTRYTHDPLQL